MGELVEKSENVVALPMVSDDTKAMMSMIEQIALNPEADVEKLRAVMDMKMEMFNRGAEIEYNAAMALAQGEMEPVVRTANNDQTRSKYARLENIIEQLAPIWTKHGFAVSSCSGDCPKDGYYRVECEVTHSSGHAKQYHADLPPDTTGIKGNVNKTPLHGFGSTMNYGRRYLICMIFNIALKNEDQDGNQPRVICLNNAQIKTLRDAMTVAGVTDKQFCTKAQIERVEELPQKRLAGSINMLQKYAQGAEQ